MLHRRIALRCDIPPRLRIGNLDRAPSVSLARSLQRPGLKV